jgi:hypothetical protein
VKPLSGFTPGLRSVSSWVPNVPCPLFHHVSSTLIIFIAHLLYHATSHTPSPMQTMHHPLVPPPILTNHTPPITSFYWPLDFHWKLGPQPYTFLNSLGHAHVGAFPLSILQPFQFPMIKPPNLPPFHHHFHLTSTYTRRNVIHFDYIFVSKALCMYFLNVFASQLSPYQFEVTIKGGCEVVVHGIQTTLDAHCDSMVLQVDIVNTFNTLSRIAIFHELRTTKG